MFNPVWCHLVIDPILVLETKSRFWRTIKVRSSPLSPKRGVGAGVGIGMLTGGAKYLILELNNSLIKRLLMVSGS